MFHLNLSMISFLFVNTHALFYQQLFVVRQMNNSNTIDKNKCSSNFAILAWRILDNLTLVKKNMNNKQKNERMGFGLKKTTS